MTSFCLDAIDRCSTALTFGRPATQDQYRLRQILYSSVHKGINLVQACQKLPPRRHNQLQTFLHSISVLMYVVHCHEANSRLRDIFHFDCCLLSKSTIESAKKSAFCTCKIFLNKVKLICHFFLKKGVALLLFSRNKSAALSATLKSGVHYSFRYISIYFSFFQVLY